MIFNDWNYIATLNKTDPWGLYWTCTDFTQIHRLFKIPYDDLMHIIYTLTKELNISYNDFNNMPFFEILNILQVYKDNIEELQKQNEQENTRMEKLMSRMLNKYNYNDMQRQMNNYKPPTYTPPKFDIPKF